MDAFVDLFITLCIVINTAFMAMEQDGMDHHMETTLRYGNYVSSKISVEAGEKGKNRLSKFCAVAKLSEILCR